MSGEELVFADTNILVYAQAAEEGHKEETARKVLRELLGQNRLCLSTQILQELFVTLTRKRGMKTASARRVIEDWTWARVVGMDARAVVEGTRIAEEHSLSFWDAMVVGAAQRMGATTLLSEDLIHGQVIRGVKILNPFK